SRLPGPYKRTCTTLITTKGGPAGSPAGPPSLLSGSAAPADRAATLADVAGAGGAHLGPAGHAHRCVRGLALELLHELGRGVDRGVGLACGGAAGAAGVGRLLLGGRPGLGGGHGLAVGLVVVVLVIVGRRR